MHPDRPLKVFTTCPLAAMAPARHCRRHIEAVARWSEAAGCEGILVFTDNAQLDPWVVSQLIVDATESLCPLVAVQPVYMHPYSVAKLIASLAHVHGRRVYLNMVAGGFKNDLVALGDTTAHDERYARLIEYTTIIQRLLAGPGPVSFEGRYYRIGNVKLMPEVPAELRSPVFVSGSSAAGVEAAQALGATAIEYPKPSSECAATPDALMPRGMRIGIITRRDDAEAWSVARARFPSERKGQLAHQLAMKVSDSSWHRQLSELAADEDSPYWLVPFQNYKAVCPYLVGSYERVAAEIGRYVDAGYRTFILDEPAGPDELRHTSAAFAQATRLIAQ